MTDVTIVVATYNRPQMLQTELYSILASAATVTASVRVLVVDDASPTMAAQDVCERVGVDYIRRATNGGVAATLATGFEQVDSPYYAFWGDDDFMLPRWFKLHLERIAEGHDVVSSSFWLTDADLAPYQQYTLEPVTMADLLANSVSANDGSLVRRDAVERLRPERERAMMLTLWLSLAAAGKSFSTITEPTWYYRRHAGNISTFLVSRRDARFYEMRRQAIAEYTDRLVGEPNSPSLPVGAGTSYA